MKSQLLPAKKLSAKTAKSVVSAPKIKSNLLPLIQFDRNFAPPLETLEMIGFAATHGCADSRAWIRDLLDIVNPQYEEQLLYVAPCRDAILDEILDPLLSVCLNDMFEAQCLLEAMVERLQERAELE